MISIKNLIKNYGVDGKTINILTIPNFVFENNTSYMIKGKSGKGKTTLLNIICGLENPTSGEIAINDVLIYTLTESARDTFRANNIGYLFQDYHLLEKFCVLDNIVMPLVMVTKKTKKEALDIAQSALASVEMDTKANVDAKKLSGGEKQRVALARALSTNPSIILADEPIGNLDSDSGDKVMTLILEQAKLKKATLIVVSHDREYDNLFDVVIDIDELSSNEKEGY